MVKYLLAYVNIVFYGSSGIWGYVNIVFYGSSGIWGYDNIIFYGSSDISWVMLTLYCMGHQVSQRRTLPNWCSTPRSRWRRSVSSPTLRTWASPSYKTWVALAAAFSSFTLSVFTFFSHSELWVCVFVFCRPAVDPDCICAPHFPFFQDLMKISCPSLKFCVLSNLASQTSFNNLVFCAKSNFQDKTFLGDALEFFVFS